MIVQGILEDLERLFDVYDDKVIVLFTDLYPIVRDYHGGRIRVKPVYGSIAGMYADIVVIAHPRLHRSLAESDEDLKYNEWINFSVKPRLSHGGMLIEFN